MSIVHGIYIITGIMASGKSTVAQLLAEKAAKSAHLRGDIFRRMMVSGRAEMTEKPTEEAIRQLHLRYKLAAQAAEGYFSAGFTTVLQDNYLGKEINDFLSHFTLAPIYLVTLCPSIQAIKAREASRKKKGYINWDVEALYGTLVKENPRIGLWLDSTDQTPEETVVEIVARYQTEARIL